MQPRCYYPYVPYGKRSGRVPELRAGVPALADPRDRAGLHPRGRLGAARRGGAGEFPDLLDMMGSLDPTQSDSRATRELCGSCATASATGSASGGSHDGGAMPAAALPIPGSAGPRSPIACPPTCAARAGESTSARCPSCPSTGPTRSPRPRSPTRPCTASRTSPGSTGRGPLPGPDGRLREAPRALRRGYMALIKPFRYLIVYPALMREFERTWSHDHPQPTSEGARG